MSASVAESLSLLPESARAKALDGLTTGEAASLEYDWSFWGRPEQQLPPGYWFVWLILSGRGWGKLLAHDTPLVTPSGWTTMGAVTVGDALFDEAGRPCCVTAKFSPPVTQAYRITFSDGEQIVADGDHQWVTWTHRDRKQFLRRGGGCYFPPEWPVYRQGSFGSQIRTTSEIRETLRLGTRGDLNHCVPIAGALRLEPLDLAIEPWLLGYWLGNGTLGRSHVTAGSYGGVLDADYVCAAIARAGYAMSRTDYAEKGQSSIGVPGLSTRLAALGVLDAKAVPAEYLRASVEQRTALLRGLMDSDGHAERSKVEFCSLDRALAESVRELVNSLGERCYVVDDRARLNGVDYGPRYRVMWRPSLFLPFSLPRKVARVGRLGGAQAFKLRHRMIVSVAPVDAVPMSCITVDSPNSMYLAGRGMVPTHNTRTAVENIAKMVRGSTPLTAPPNAPALMSFVADNTFDMRQYSVEGPSGFLNVGPPDFRPRHHPGKMTLEWPNGCKALLFSAEDPEATRGASGSFFWWDELAKAKKAELGWTNMLFGMREGNPRGIVTTTPRPIPLIRKLKASASTRVTIGSTWDNRVNLSEIYYREVVAPLAGTRLGRQEINAEILDDVPGALWTREMIDRARKPVVLPDMARIVVAVDPSGARSANDEKADSIGIVVAGKGVDGRGYVLADRTCKLSPAGWGRRAVDAYHEFKADRIVAERNFGGAMVESTIRTVDPEVAYKEVVASRGKAARAEPISALYEQGRVSHIGELTALEDQMCQMGSGGYLGEGSPDRLDAAVWALMELMAGVTNDGIIEFMRREVIEHNAALGTQTPFGAPTASEGRVAMIAPPGISTVYGMTGTKYDVSAEGVALVSPEDVGPLRAAGFHESIAADVPASQGQSQAR